MATTDHLVEMNRATALLRRHGYSYADHGTWVIVDDPVHMVSGKQLKRTGHQPVVIRSAQAARDFIVARS